MDETKMAIMRMMKKRKRNLRYRPESCICAGPLSDGDNITVNLTNVYQKIDIQ
jgi:hypothetical protein